MRDGLLNETLFHGLDHARALIRELMEDYNGCRPHSSIGYRTPTVYAETISATGSGIPDPVASDAPHGVTTTAAALIRGWMNIPGQVIEGKMADMRAAGSAAEQIARSLYAERRALGHIT